jgi:S1-C subfamily serine protease
LGGVAALTVQRGGKSLVLSLKLAAAPETPPREAIRIKSRSPFQGALVMNVSPAVAEELSLEGVSEGVVVADVAEGSLAANFGVQKGDVVLEVNGEKIATTRDLESASAQRARAWDLTISRGGEAIRSRIGG